MFAKRLLNGLFLAAVSSAALAACSSGDVPDAEGTLRLYGGLDLQGRPFTRYALDTKSGIVPLEFDPTLMDVSKLGPAQRVAAYGERTADGKLRVRQLDMIEPEENAGIVRQQLTFGGTRTAKLLVLMVYRDAPDGQTIDNIKQTLLTSPTSTRALFKESSFNKLDITADVFGWFKIPASSTCDEGKMAEDAKAAARATNVEPDLYDHVLYYFPSTTLCAFSGLGEVGSPTSPARTTWYNGEFSLYVTSHELGHNMGFWHAHSLDCGNVAIASAASCTPWEYGDTADPMGGLRIDFNNGHVATQYSGYNKAAQNWIGGCNVVTTPVSGDYWLTPTETQSTEPQVLRIKAPNSVCPADLPSCYYYVEYRQPIGAIDGSDYFKTTPMQQGVLIRLGGDLDQTGTSSVQGAYLIDTNPSIEDDYMDARLGFGKTFTDSAGVQITAVAAESGKAHVKITLSTGSGSATCLNGTVYGGSSGSCADFVQPMAGQPGYKLGDKVKFNGANYESTLNGANYWSPTAAPQYWKSTTCSTSTSSCTDGVKNGSETGVDCGGSCPACATCTDRIKNGSETGVDCGGSCPACATCTDRIKNGNETGVDCGGSCPACPSCTDGIKNGSETGIDCGGSCAPCSTTSCTAFVQPYAGQPGYKIGDKVLFNALGYASTINNNYWSPSAAPQYWKSTTCN